MRPTFVVHVFLAHVIAWAMTWAAVRTAHADEATVRREDQFKAAYLFNFVQFVEWPAKAAGVAGGSPADVLTVCFAGGDGVYAVLAAGIENKRAGNHHLAVRQLAARVDAALDGCNVLYEDSAASGGNVKAGAGNLPILTVSDAKTFLQSGGMIELFMDGNRLRFRINVENAQKAGLHISSDLLQLAAGVEGSVH
jgi:hypothetical protein